MVYKDLHHRKSDNTAVVEHSGTPETNTNPGGEATPSPDEKPQERTPPKDSDS